MQVKTNIWYKGIDFHTPFVEATEQELKDVEAFIELAMKGGVAHFSIDEGNGITHYFSSQAIAESVITIIKRDQ